jgi:hypothetical protein
VRHDRADTQLSPSTDCVTASNNFLDKTGSAVPETERFTLHLPPTAAEKETLYAKGVLRPEQLTHGAYYAGHVHSTPAVARWHAAKRRFVLLHSALGVRGTKAIPHVADARTEEMFLPLSEKVPTDEQRISDYAFETSS